MKKEEGEKRESERGIDILRKTDRDMKRERKREKENETDTERER